MRRGKEEGDEGQRRRGEEKDEDVERKRQGK
jgi:hypothetical protein